LTGSVIAVNVFWIPRLVCGVCHVITPVKLLKINKTEKNKRGKIFGQKKTAKTGVWRFVREGLA
jgi:hypothetical protein